MVMRGFNAYEILDLLTLEEHEDVEIGGHSDSRAISGIISDPIGGPMVGPTGGSNSAIRGIPFHHFRYAPLNTGLSQARHNQRSSLFQRRPKDREELRDHAIWSINLFDKVHGDAPPGQ